MDMDKDFNPTGRYIGKLYNLMRRRLWNGASELGCSKAEMSILAFIIDSRTPVYQKDIEDEFLLRGSSATGRLKDLEEKGLLMRRQEEGDARLKRIIPSGRALEAREDIKRILSSFESDMTAGIDSRDLAAFRRVAERMIENLSAAGSINGGRS